ncbi:ergot alkaloid biosynthesis protein [Mycolicibacterium cosmeticum]|uniref:NmrA family protein n=1 Tax=Mycolicibacterium cosmeticum TaxID=258533 RepID=W9ALK4_MYCCO|nr:NAD(P)H-binding protein [Mycolicibacterium cosmeticum]TLH71264.1 ergot alkaloid biosynthesis protein [Mycolicibacterium cosmeticum]CDO06373.1 NmrA family protein [Mycolicibacterium cosmeticum]
MTGSVLVLGASGNTGSAVVDALAEYPDVRVRTGARRPIGPATAEQRRFDWTDPETHQRALDGVDRVYLVAPVGDPDPVRLVGPFLQQAVAMGVRRVVLLSSSAVADGDPGLGVVATEVRKLLPEWEILRPSWFMQNFVGRHPLADSIRATGEFVTATGHCRIPFIDARDIGRCAARLLTAERAGNAEHHLTGPQALSYDDAAAVMAAVTGRPVRHRAVDPGSYIETLVASGYDRAFASALAALDEQIRDGRQAHVTDTVERLTGRAPTAFADYLREHAGLASCPV